MGAIAADIPHLRALVRANRRITHTAPRAKHGVFTIALAVRHAGTTQGQVQGQVFYQDLAAHIANAPCLTRTHPARGLKASWGAVHHCRRVHLL